MARSRNLAPADLGLGVLLVASLVARLPFVRDGLNDDAFISLRYARNLASGSGLVFNAGERVEGITNFLWTLLLASAMRLHLDPVVGAQIASMLPVIALPALVYRFGLRYGQLPSRAWGLVAPFLVVTHPSLVAESVGGLETTFFVLLVFVGFERALAERHGEARRGSAAAAFGIATLVRPEAFLAFVLWVAVESIAARSQGRFAALRAGIAVYAALVVPLVVFRLAYYGDWVPNTFHAKVGWSAAQVSRGAAYVRDTGWTLFPPPVLVAAFWGALGGGWRTALGLGVAVQAAAVALLGGDYFPTGRFLLVLVPAVSLLAQEGIVRAIRSRQRIRWAAPATCFLLLVSAAWSIPSESHRLRVRGWPSVARADLQARRYLGRTFAATLAPDATVAVGSIGAIGYYADRRILDTFGLTNAIGRLHVEWMGQASAGHEKGDADIVLRAEPQVIVFDRAFLARRPMSFEEFLGEARSPTEHLLVEDPRLYAEYGLRSLSTPVGVLHYLERVRTPGGD